MNVEKINSNTFSQSFRAKKFRVPVDVRKIERKGESSHIRKVSGNWVQEFSNPKAEDIYVQVMKTEDVNRGLQLLKSMGPSKTKNISLSSRIRNWYDEHILKRILKDEWV